MTREELRSLPYRERKKAIIDSMIGKTFKSVKTLDYNGKEVEILADSVVFVSESGENFIFYHDQDCCECVSIDDIAGDLSDLEGEPLLSAEEVSGEIPDVNRYGSFTYTFYKFETRKGSVTIRWFGESNGYYSEEVDVLYQTTDGIRLR